MTEDDWSIVLDVFDASHTGSGEPGHNDRKFLEAVHYFTVHGVTWRALPAEFGNWNTAWKRFWRPSPSGVFDLFFEAFGSHQHDGASGTDVLQHRHAGACLGRRRKRGQQIRRSDTRGRFLEQDPPQTDLAGLLIGFHLAGGEVSDSTQFKVSLDMGLDIKPRAAMTDKGYDISS